jgi:Uma2 family endonuclease
MTIVESKSRVTPEELLAMPEGNSYELVDGELVEREMGYKSAYTSARIIGLLYEFTHRKNIGWIADSEAGFQCFPDDPNRVRKPDVTFTRKERLPDPPSGNCRISPDIAVEVVSPNDLYSKLTLKVEEYLRAAVKLVWVVDPDSKTILVYRCDNTVSKLSVNDELSGEDALPGFHVPVAEIFHGL